MKQVWYEWPKEKETETEKRWLVGMCRLACGDAVDKNRHHHHHHDLFVQKILLHTNFHDDIYKIHIFAYLFHDWSTRTTLLLGDWFGTSIYRLVGAVYVHT